MSFNFFLHYLLFGCNKYEEIEKKLNFAFPNYVKCSVVKVINGNTFNCQFPDIQIERVKLIGVKIPNSFKQEAADFSGSYLRRGLPVKLEFDLERYDDINIFAYVYLPGDKMLNALLIEKGFAEYKANSPNVKHEKYLLSLQEKAKDQRRGIWGESRLKSE